MIISVINHSNGAVSDEKLHRVIRAINRQIEKDFEPYWSLGAVLRLEGRSTKKPSKLSLPDLRGDAILYLWDQVEKDFLGYHETNARGIPYGFVFLDVSAAVEEDWSVTMSHEALELIADPEVNLLVKGPHPTKRGRTVFHWYEMSDAVQSETYEVDGVEVSNFVLPLYFTGGDEHGGRNDFLGRSHGGETLKSFGVNPGGYIGYFDPKTGKNYTHYGPDDDLAAMRLKVKGKVKSGRRSARYRRSLGMAGRRAL
jgi:hypothetical protein